jgi:vacuolar iron transporter family protein
MHNKHPWSENLREVIFGVEDGAIGNLGLVIGMAQALTPNHTILLAGLATMFAQAISMSAGNYLSVKSEKEYFQVKKKSRSYGKGYAEHKSPVRSSLVMAISVILGAAIPLAAFLFWESKQGILPSVVITLIGLFILGASKSKFTMKNWFRSGIEITFVGFIAAIAGFIIGNLFA